MTIKIHVRYAYGVDSEEEVDKVIEEIQHTNGKEYEIYKLPLDAQDVWVLWNVNYAVKK